MIWSGDDTDDIHVTVESQSALLADVERCLQARSGFSVATLNLDHVVKLAQDPVFRQAYQAHSYVTADGNPIVWLSRLAGQKISLVQGSELVAPLVALAALNHVPVAIFGTSEQALEAAVEVLSARHAGLEVVLARAPAMGFNPMGALAAEDIKAIGESGAGLCFLALGAPKQEVFASRAQAALPNVGFVSVGAGLDFIAGTQIRAPRWVQASAAEWVWRLMADPKRLAARYGSCIRVLPRFFVRAIKTRYTGRAIQ